MGDGYVRQSSADIVAGNTVEAGPLNAEFNQLQSAFHLSSGHSHDGTTGEGPKIGLTTSVSGVLPVANGGFAGIHKVNGTTAPTVNDDSGDGYAVGSVWLDTTNDKAYIAVDVTVAAAVWLYIGATTGWQPLDSELTALAGLTSAADKLPYFTGSGTAALADLSSFGRSIIDDASEAAFKATVNLEIGTDVQAWDAHLDDLAAISPAQGDIIYFNGTDWVALTAGTSGHFLKTNGAGANPAWTANVGVSDGDKGDIVVSGTGTVWSIEADAVGDDELAHDITIQSTLTIPNTGLHILDTNSTHDLIIKPGTNLSGDRTFTLITPDADITMTLADAGADAIYGWDDSAGTYANLSAADARTALGLATTDSPQFTAINLGDASDTTLARSAAGVVTIEGVEIVTLTRSQTLTNKTLTDPAITGAILEDIFTITDGAAFEIDPGNGTLQEITLGASRTPKATNFANGESVTLRVADGTGFTITWTDATFGGSGVVWVGGVAPTLATSGYTVIELWKWGGQVYGSTVGDHA
jgi:hypothetical protein